MKQTQNLTFASVHDSYWTHASSIDKMSEIIRDTFIALHSSDVLGKLQFEVRIQLHCYLHSYLYTIFQFQNRYKGYKIALVNLRTGNLMKHLVAAGSTIKASRDQAERIGIADAELEGLLTVSESGESSIDEKEVNIDLALKDAALDKKTKSTKRPVEDDLESELEEIEELDEVDVKLLGKFVELSDLLPPLPKKGTFEVETIKGSQYFFS